MTHHHSDPDLSPILNVRNLAKTKGDPQKTTFTLELPEMKVGPGQVVAIVGEPGCGKTTLLDLLSMTTASDRCEVFEIAAMTRGGTPDLLTAASASYEASLGGCRPHIGYALQSGGLLPFLNIWENAALPSQTFGRRVPSARIASLGARLGIGNKLDLLPRHLTASQQHRAEILRSLVHTPSLALADEIPENIAPERAARIMHDIKDLIVEQSGCAIIAARSPSMVEEFADQIYTFHQSVDPTGNHCKSICFRADSPAAFDLRGANMIECEVLH
ncbi:ATP-binding cassette domain-containing protein [Roseibium sp.]|uniref:ATP-binding cassette domain-containing protein n=1 Tax=Roseibium sp. TaxID=1936156 RepID=UPI003263107F